jgi:hypothetical protein
VASLWLLQPHPVWGKRELSQSQEGDKNHPLESSNNPIKKNKTMTTTHYTSKDNLIQVITTNDDARYPRHAAQMTIIKLSPKAHSRCRHQWGGVTVMFTHDEVRALLEAIKLCEPGFEFSISKEFRNKPETRKQIWQQRNTERTARRRNALSR